MKKIFTYFGTVLAIALMGAFSSCNRIMEDESGDVGLGIKVFFPTKVVPGQPMTINGSGFSDVREVVFPEGVSVTDFELVSNEMIRVTAPAGISAEGGTISIRTTDGEAESRLPLTLGRTVVSGFSKQEGEEIGGGEQITVYGQDLEFINGFEVLDADGEPLLLTDNEFYRKGTNTLILNIPKKVFDGTFVARLFTYDGQVILLPELKYTPVSDGGHWETVKTIVWENDGSHGAVSWSGDYRFASENNKTGEEIYAIPMDLWEKMKTETFYVTVQGSDPQVRVTTGWWSTTWTGNDIQPGNELLVDNGDGTWTLEINLSGDSILDVVDAQHLLFTGDRYTLLNIFFSEDVWVDGGGHYEIVRTSIWKNDGSHGAINWSSDYRFSSESNSTGEEIYAIPQDTWDKMKSGSFYLLAQGSDWVQMRITTGWWSTTWTGNDITTGDERILDNGDGTYVIEINFAGDPILDVLDAQHLLLTGGGYTPLELYFEEEIWVDGGGDSGPKEIDIAPFTLYEDRSANLEYPYYPSWGDNSGKIRIMRGMDPALESLGIKVGSKFIFYKEVGTTGQIQFNNPNWGSFPGDFNDWSGDKEAIEVPVTEDMLPWISGEQSDGWSDTAFIVQGDGLKITKIVIVL